MPRVAEKVAHTGQQVRWIRNPSDVYTVEGYRPGKLFKNGVARLRIVNVHGHELWVPENETYPYADRR